MTEIVNVSKAIKLAQKLKKENKKIVLAGGCFDVLHIGHIRFLKKAKTKGDVLIILLESDESVKKLKGDKRPINSLKDRAEILSSVSYIDLVVLLNEIKNNKDYDDIVININPDIIAITKGSSQKIHALRQARKINAKVISVINKVSDKSTTKLARLILEKFDE